jgi:hypothetical protein
MKIASIEFEVDDDFEPGQCYDCPLSHLDENYDPICPMYLDYSQCEITTKQCE